ncbi:SURF1 family protein [Sphingobium nicotianae]|uniref:SURF1 family protein n=1 Tax=Sphingobium nicotianae TaxID=2782607 RepID=UPI0032D912A2
MIRKLPIVPTIVVALAIAAMIGLGIWQLGRAHQKEAALAIWRANMTRPATAYPAQRPTDETYLFRRLSANCLRVIGWQEVGGRSTDGKSGWRHIATCATGAEGPGLVVDVGVSTLPNIKIAWAGGPVRGLATHEPDNTPWIARLARHGSPLRLMIVAESAAPGLAPSAPPDPASVPNNHRSYMVQWFLFAAVAAVIYGLAVRKRLRDQAAK